MAELLDRGWRRSGSFLYRPEMKRTCCPSYTIRLKADEFKPSKEQLRVLKKIQRFCHRTSVFSLTLNLSSTLLGNQYAPFFKVMYSWYTDLKVMQH